MHLLHVFTKTVGCQIGNSHKRLFTGSVQTESYIKTDKLPCRWSDMMDVTGQKASLEILRMAQSFSISSSRRYCRENVLLCISVKRLLEVPVKSSTRNRYMFFKNILGNVLQVDAKFEIIFLVCTILIFLSQINE